MSLKDTNPKDAIGSTKVSLHLIPSPALVAMSLAFAEGAMKYGKFNWRVSGVRASVYIDALGRHLAKWADGEDCDPVTRVPHLASAMACLAIVIDADVCGKLTDDRPPRNHTALYVEACDSIFQHLKELYKDRTPHQHTITDREEGIGRLNSCS